MLKDGFAHGFDGVASFGRKEVRDESVFGVAVRTSASFEIEYYTDGCRFPDCSVGVVFVPQCSIITARARDFEIAYYMISAVDVVVTDDLHFSFGSFFYLILFYIDVISGCIVNS
ncbi:MAG: hypothetical protein Q4E54_03625 [Lachnospiraceae bacterium]|nr:hypothetical protein [Lachnospiraceae bacterium]